MRSFSIRALAVSLCLMFTIGFGTAAADPAPPPASDVAGVTGPYATAQTIDAGACRSLYGAIADAAVRGLGGNTAPLTCSDTFPNGLSSPVGVHLYYPTNAPQDVDLPVVIWTGGIFSEPGNYDAFSKMLASNGYVVAVPYDFVNSLAYLPLIATSAVSRADKDANSVLHDRVDLSNIAVAGHSAGGAAAQQAASLPPNVWTLIDSRAVVKTAVAVEPGPIALGSLTRVPTLYLSGTDDFVVPHFLWVRWTQYELTTAVPAWLLCARGVTHFTPVDDPANNPLAPIVLDFLDYQLRSDPAAEKAFVGPSWTLGSDPALSYALRNRAADALVAQ